jgi:hypothetical protein
MVSLSIAQENFNAQPLARLFLIPNAKVLPSMQVNLTLGGTYGTMNKGEYLGIAGVGLGNVAELEVSTWRLVSNLFNGTTALGTTSLKVQLLKAMEGTNLPDVNMTFRSNPSWADIEYSGGDLSGDVAQEVSEIRFQMHLASLFLAFSEKLFKDVTMHAGVSLTDVRTRSGSALYWDQASYTEIPNTQKNLVSGFIGFERQVNPKTILMVEASGNPRFNFNTETGKIEIDQVALVIAGVRFYFTERISTDAGVKYRTDYAGIADAEISVGLNFGFNLQEFFKSE